MKRILNPVGSGMITYGGGTEEGKEQAANRPTTAQPITNTNTGEVIKDGQGNAVMGGDPATLQQRSLDAMNTGGSGTQITPSQVASAPILPDTLANLDGTPGVTTILPILQLLLLLLLEQLSHNQIILRAASGNMMEASITSPGTLATTAAVDKIDPNAVGTTIAEGTGALDPNAPQITGPDSFNAASVDPTKAADGVSSVTDNLEAVQGSLDPAAKVEAEQKDPTTLSAKDLEAQQIAQAQTVSPAAKRTIESGEMISGSAVDMAAVDEALDIQAAQADPSAQATVKGQLGQLMLDFDGTNPPAWAAGALRNASAQMAARGLGASSMAGQALVQAAMESAVPIAMADAQTFAKFESQNLSNRQQTTMFAAQQRAQFLNLEFSQEFQTRVANASRVADIANMNFTAEQQIALENARMAQTVDITNLNAKNAKMMSDAAAMSQMDMQNLNNRQQAAVMNAQSFLAMDMKNMDLNQQTVYV